MSELSAYLLSQKKLYIVGGETGGGRSRGFRKHIGDKYQEDPDYFKKLTLDAFMEAATRTWERPSRKRGPDLFAVAGYKIPEFLTRPASNYVDGEDLDDDADEAFEKVDAKFATVQDLLHDATIKLRKAAQSSAAAEEEMKAVDLARRLARGDMSVYLRDIADAKKDKAAAPADQEIGNEAPT